MSPRSAALRLSAATLVLEALSTPLGAQSADSIPLDSTSQRLAPITAGLRAPARSIGSTRLSLDSSDVRRGARPRTLSELLQARLPGVSVLRFGGDPSDGARVRVRGATTVVGAAEPLLVVDGVPMGAPELLGPETSLSPTSRFDDFDPEEIEQVDVLPGPAATTLFGAGASNGAIVVTTKRGVAGRPRWDAWSQGAVSSEPTTYPANYRMNGTTTSTGTAMSSCDVAAIANRLCTPTTLDVWNPLEAVSPFRMGHYGAGGGSIAGGPLGIRVYASALGRAETSVLDDSWASRVNGRLNAERELFGRVTIAGNLGYVRRNATIRWDNVVARGLLGSAVDDTSHGYRPLLGAPPTADRDGDRLSRSARVEWRALSWLRAHAIVGRDELTQNEAQISPSIGSDFPSIRSTTRHWWASSIVNGTIEAQHRARGSIGLRTLVSYEESNRKTAEEELRTTVGPCQTIFCGNIAGSGAWTRTSLRSWMVQERLAVGDRIFLNVGARRIAEERSNGGGRWHPSVDAVWDLGRVGADATLRLRGAYAVGVPPRHSGFVSALLPLSPAGPVTIGGQPQFTPIEPERPREAELGLDASFGTRVELNATFFDQRTPDLIVPVALPPTTGFSGRGLGLGQMENRGLELMGRVRLVDRPATRWTAAMTLATLRNRVTGLDGVAPSVFVGPGIRNGQPFGVFVTQRVTFVDANGDNLPAASEMTLGSAEPSGGVNPTREASLRSELGLKRWGLALSATLDHRGGHRAYNMSEYYNCLFRRCRAWQDPTATLAEKTEVVASSLTTLTQFSLEDASYTRLGELAVEWTPSARFGSVIPSGLTIGVEARNLVTWTSFGGPDPEVATTSSARRARQQIEMLPALPRTVGVRIGFAPR